MGKQSRGFTLGAMALALAIMAMGCGKSLQSLAPEAATPASVAVDAAIARDDRDAAAEQNEDDAEFDAARLATPIGAPTTITQPGDYRLTNDISVNSGDGIVIAADHVRLWLGEHRLIGPGNKLGRAVVIDGAQHVSVRGGRIERFGMGAVLVDASNCQIRSMTILGGDETANPPAGNPPQIGIMLINSAMNHVSGNRLSRVNLGLFVRGPGSYGNRILRNTVMGGDNGLLAICYNPAPGGDPAGAHDDRVSLNVLSRFRTGIVASAQSAENAFTLNTIRYFSSAYQDENGTNVFEHNRTEQISP